MKRRYYPKPKPTKAHKRAALLQVVTFREDLDVDDRMIESWSRSYSVPADEIRAMIQSEIAKRTWNDLR